MRRDRADLFAFSIFRKAPHDRPRYGDSSLKGKGVYLGRLYLPKNKSGADSGVGEELRGATGQGALISAFRNNFVRYMAFEPYNLLKFDFDSRTETHNFEVKGPELLQLAPPRSLSVAQ